jgi:4-amino-4-deoxy-L-arabinose transferase-like glycosyltransferase
MPMVNDIQTDRGRRWFQSRAAWTFLAITLLGFLLRLLTVYWRRSYDPVGDELGFLNQALALAWGEGYHDQPLMRMPLYPLFLAGLFWLPVRSGVLTAVTNLVLLARLAQAILSTATIPLVYLWARQRFNSRTGLLAAGLCALFFPFCLQPTFLLTETLFLFLFALSMVLAEWTVGLWVGPQKGQWDWWAPLLSGASFGLVILTRAIGWPLVGLAALVFFLKARPCGPRSYGPRWRPAVLVVLGTVLVLLPWSVRNWVAYEGFIPLDNTAAANLWMDNDPQQGSREVKALLLQYPRAERSRVALQEGLRLITDNPGWFIQKYWRGMQRFLSLEYFDTFRRRPDVWYPAGEIWARSLLGDGLYLLLVAAGIAGLAGTRTRLKVLDLFWVLYVLIIVPVFHIHVRFRLPLYLPLIPYAAAALVGLRDRFNWLRRRPGRASFAGIALVGFAVVLLSHANYPRMSLQILRKRVHLASAERALSQGDWQRAGERARSALSVDVESAWARELLSQALRQQGHLDEAEEVLREAFVYHPNNPHPHLLLGDLLKAQGRLEAAAEQLAYEQRGYVEDLQQWAWDHFLIRVPSSLDLDRGFALGHIQGWHAAELTGGGGRGESFRWSGKRVRFRLVAPAGVGSCRLTLVMTAGRPAGVPLPEVELWREGERFARFIVENGWAVYELDVGDWPPGMVLHFELRSQTFQPQQLDPLLKDDRNLGVMVDWIRLLR